MGLKNICFDLIIIWSSTRVCTPSKFFLCSDTVGVIIWLNKSRNDRWKLPKRFCGVGLWNMCAILTYGWLWVLLWMYIWVIATTREVLYLYWRAMWTRAAFICAIWYCGGCYTLSCCFLDAVWWFRALSWYFMLLLHVCGCSRAIFRYFWMHFMLARAVFKVYHDSLLYFLDNWWLGRGTSSYFR